jgi:hypothetical protein
MHWFDRISRQLAAAPETQATRRGVFKGLGVAAVGSPFASQAAAYANNRMKAKAAADDCLGCLTGALSDYKGRLQGCAQNYGGAAKKKPKKKKTTTPAKSAAELACAATAREKLLKKAELCRTSSRCRPTAPEPLPHPVTGELVCPSGTSACGPAPNTSCCYGGDACCTCAAAGGYICCAGVIGCTCC